MGKISSCKCGNFKVDTDMYPEPTSEGITNCPDCNTSPYNVVVKQDIVKKEAVPEGMLRTFTIGMGDVMIGMASEMPDHIIMHIVPAEVALAIPLELAYTIHDGLCAAINILDGGASLELDENDLPDDKKKWN